MALYENVFIARQDVPTTQVETLTNQFAELVTGLGGSVSKKEYMASPAAQKDASKAENRFKTLDKNNDGKLSKDEFDAGQKKNK